MKILKFWGIPIHKILSDTEFVEKTRKGLRLSKKLVWIHVAVLLVMCVIVPKMITIVWDVTKDSPDESKKWIGAGLIFGFIFGAIIEQCLFSGFQAILTALDLFDYNRGSRLLIKYHDMLQEIAVQQQDYEQQDEQVF